MANSTLKQIAAELGVSVSTVSRAINGKSVVNEETRRRVLDLAERYAGGTSNTVLHPLIPSFFILYAALA